MKGKILKGSIIAIILIIFLVSSVSAENANDETKVLTLSKGGLVINYPSDWGYS